MYELIRQVKYLLDPEGFSQVSNDLWISF